MKIFLFLLISLMIISAVTPAPPSSPHIKGEFCLGCWLAGKLEKFVQKQNTAIKNHEPDGHPTGNTNGHPVGHSVGHSGGYSGGHTGGEITLDSIKQKNHISEEFSINSLAKSNPGQKVPEGNNKFIKDESHSVGVSRSSHETSFKLSETFHDSKTKEASDNSGVSSNPGKSTNPFRQPEGAEKTGAPDKFNKLKRDSSHTDSDDASNSHKDIPPNKITKTSSDSETSQASDDFGKSSNLEKVSREGDIGHPVSQSPIVPNEIEKKKQENPLKVYLREEYEKFYARYTSDLHNKISKKSPDSITKDDSHKISGNKNTKLSSDSKTKEADYVEKSSIMQKIFPGFDAHRYIPNNFKKSKPSRNDDTEKLLNDDIQNNSDHHEIPMDKISKTSSESETKDAIDALGQFN